MNDLTVSTFWQGSLSLYERACLLSFAVHGFQVEVYAYHPLDLPEGIVWRDAREVLDVQNSPVYTHDGKPDCVVAFSDLFRYTLLAVNGGIWVDADVFCLKPAKEYRALQEQAPHRLLVAYEDAEMLNTAVMMAEGFHPLLARLQKAALEHTPALKQWGSLGPRLLTDLAQQYPHQMERLDPASFYPLHYLEATACLIPSLKHYCQEKSQGSYALHLWNSVLKTYCLPQNILPPEGSFLHSLFSSVLPDASSCLPEQTLTRLLQGTQALKTLNQKENPTPPPNINRGLFTRIS